MIKDLDLKSLYYHITNGCNLRCKHCWVESGSIWEDELSLEEAKDVVLQAIPLGLKTVKLTGGEPFIVPWLMDFLQFLDGHSISMAFETNGTLIGSDIAGRLAAMKVEGIAVSLDGSTAAIHEALRGVKGCFEAALKGIRNLTGAGLHPGILVAVDRTNLNDIPDLIALGDTLKVRYIKLNVITPTGRARQLEKTGRLLSRTETQQLFLSVPELEQGASAEIMMAYPPLLTSVSRMRRHMCACCDIAHVLGLLADGRVAMCGIGSTDDHLIYGNIRHSSLKEIWQTRPHPVLQELRSKFPEQLTGVCGQCVFKNQCRGSCRAMAFQRYGSVTAPSPLCQESLEAGLVSSERLVTSDS